MSVQTEQAAVNQGSCECEYPNLLCTFCESTLVPLVPTDASIAAQRLRADLDGSEIPAELRMAARRLKQCRPALASRIDAALPIAMDPSTIAPEYCATVRNCKCSDRKFEGRGTRSCAHTIALYLRRQAWPEGGAA